MRTGTSSFTECVEENVECSFLVLREFCNSACLAVFLLPQYLLSVMKLIANESDVSDLLSTIYRGKCSFK